MPRRVPRLAQPGHARASPTLPAPASEADRLAQEMSHERITWPVAHDTLRRHYLATGDKLRYTQVTAILADAFPWGGMLQFETAAALIELGRAREAVRYSSRAVGLEPRNGAMRGNLASTYLASGDVDAGIREFRKAVEIAPENSRIRAGLAVSYFALGRYEEAVKEFDRAKSLGAQFEPSVREALERIHPPTHPES